MSKLSRRVSFSSDQGTAKPTALARNKKRVITVFWVFRLPKSGRFSPENFLRRLGAKVAKVLRYMSLKKRSSSSHSQSSSTKNNGSGGGGGDGSNSKSFKRSQSVSESMEESHRAEAVKDCINFFNNSSSSKSV